MPAPSADFKKALKRLSEAEKETLLLRAVRRDAELYDTYRYELLDDVTLASLQADTEDQLHELFNLSVSGYQLHKALPKALSKALKEVARARRITKSKQLEIDLQLYLLKLIMRSYSGPLNSSHASFYKATARLALRTATMVLKNLHEDYWSEYKADLDDILAQLRTYDNRWQLSFELPTELSLPH